MYICDGSTIRRRTPEVFHRGSLSGPRCLVRLGGVVERRVSEGIRVEVQRPKKEGAVISLWRVGSFSVKGKSTRVRETDLRRRGSLCSERR